jgi:hypothetical protein
MSTSSIPQVVIVLASDVIGEYRSEASVVHDDEVVVDRLAELECTWPGIVASENRDCLWVHRIGHSYGNGVESTTSADYNRHPVEGHVWLPLLPNENPVPTVHCLVSHPSLSYATEIHSHQ